MLSCCPSLHSGALLDAGSQWRLRHHKQLHALQGRRCCQLLGLWHSQRWRVGATSCEEVLCGPNHHSRNPSRTLLFVFVLRSLQSLRVAVLSQTIGPHLRHLAPQRCQPQYQWSAPRPRSRNAVSHQRRWLWQLGSVSQPYTACCPQPGFGRKRRVTRR